MIHIDTSVNAGVKRECIDLDEDYAEYQPKKKRRKTTASRNVLTEAAKFLPLREDK